MTQSDVETWSPGPVTSASAQRRAPLPVRVELARQFTQWRVRGVLLVLAALPIIVRLAFLIGGDGDTGSDSSQGLPDFAAQAQSSGVNFAAFTLSVTGGFLLTLVVALLFGDMVASEASRSTLKYLLTIPVSRGRLLRTKIVVSLLLLAFGLLLLAGMSLLVGVLSYGTGGLQIPLGTQLGFGESIARIAGATAVIGVNLLWAAGLGTLLTVLTDSPLGAAGGVVLTSIVSSILNAIPALGDVSEFLPTHYSTAFRQLFASPVDWEPVADSVLVSLIYAVVFVTFAGWWFGRKDISS
ncbi:ABC transporter permease [Amnibacterium flavum]|uniref:ABC transporter permease n=1 Tax=Amnibacterium flavum TaxID=2173173 RepID=A0A2V1HWJ1_9MICO|nr:ABC transporter permease subunit [Amnibacterium flavum]PVZ94574.1 ABC transporter permease [Amnibacterium flavum]